MSFLGLIKDSQIGIKKKIYSRKNNFTVSVEEFQRISIKYFNGISFDKNYCFPYDEKDLSILKFILRWYYQLWIEISQSKLCIHKELPTQYRLIKNFSLRGTKSFKKNTILFLQPNKYSLCNWNKGIPLWDSPEDYSTAYCQVNYDLIEVHIPEGRV